MQHLHICGSCCRALEGARYRKILCAYHLLNKCQLLPEPLSGDRDKNPFVFFNFSFSSGSFSYIVKKVFMYALKVLFTLSHIKQVDSRLLIQSTMELEEAFAFEKTAPLH